MENGGGRQVGGQQAACVGQDRARVHYAQAEEGQGPGAVEDLSGEKKTINRSAHTENVTDISTSYIIVCSTVMTFYTATGSNSVLTGSGLGRRPIGPIGWTPLVPELMQAEVSHVYTSVHLPTCA